MDELAELLSTNDLARRFGVTKWAISRWVRDGIIERVMVGGKYVYRREEVQRLEAELAASVPIASAAAKLGISRQWVYQLMADGQLEGVMFRGQRRITRESMNRYVRARSGAGGQEKRAGP